MCTGCNGRIRTRRTVTAHKTVLQHPIHKNYRLCHCSLHPLGGIVHRHTLRIHRLTDEANGHVFTLPTFSDPDEDFVPEDFESLQAIANASMITEALARYNDTTSGDDNSDCGVDSGDEEDADEVVEEEEMDAIEREPEKSMLSAGRRTIDFPPILVDCLTDIKQVTTPGWHYSQEEERDQGLLQGIPLNCGSTTSLEHQRQA